MDSSSGEWGRTATLLEEQKRVERQRAFIQSMAPFPETNSFALGFLTGQVAVFDPERAAISHPWLLSLLPHQ
eukprot:m.5578 g.5578  ORF g.5578 m.5578 type:complete len:72 (-) comp5057_c0_seq1:413-628(-)